MANEEHPNPLKRIEVSGEPPCPNCGCRLSLERIREEIQRVRRQARERERLRELAQAQAQAQRGGLGTPVTPGQVATRHYSTLHQAASHTFGSGFANDIGTMVGDLDINVPTVNLTSRACSKCGVRFEPQFQNEREALLDELEQVRLASTDAIDLLGDLARGDEG